MAGEISRCRAMRESNLRRRKRSSSKHCLKDRTSRIIIAMRLVTVASARGNDDR
jgi:hypothetical protein